MTELGRGNLRFLQGVSKTSDYLISALVSCVLVVVLFGDRLLNVDAPWGSGDMSNYYNLVRSWSGWGFAFSDQMAFPLGSDPNLYAGEAVIPYALGSLVYQVAGSPFAGLNIVLLLSFPLVAVLAMACLRVVGLTGPFAVVLSVSFAFIPFHIYRGFEHLHLALLFGATAGMLVVLYLASGLWQRWTEFSSDGFRVRRLIGVGVLLLVSSWTTLYFAVYTIILLIAAVIWRWAQGDGKSALLKAMALPVFAAGATALSLVPTYLARQRVVGGDLVGARDHLDSVTFAGNLFVAASPAPNVADFSLYNQLALAIVETWPSKVESLWLSNYGTWISSACLVVYLVGLAWASRQGRLQQPSAFAGAAERPQASLTSITYLLVVSLLFFIPWGANFLFALGVSTQIRAWNRMTPIVLLLVLLGAAACLARWQWTKGPVVGAVAVILGVVVVAYTQVIPAKSFAQTIIDEGIAERSVVGKYARGVSDAAPSGCGVFTLPIMKFPNAGPYDAVIDDYDHLRLLLTGEELAISYGGHEGTPEAEVQQQFRDDWKNQPIVEQDIVRLQDLGFCGIHLDRGEQSNSQDVHDQLRKILGEPRVLSEDSRLEYFSFT